MTEEKQKQEEKKVESETIGKSPGVTSGVGELAGLDKKPEKVKKEIVETPKEEDKKETKELAKEEIKKSENKKGEVKEEKKEEKVEVKKETKPKKKKTDAVVSSVNLPISTKYSVAICKFVKGKKINIAIKDLEEVLKKKKAVPMKGEIPHRKGIMSGRYPKKASENFIKLLKNLSANANVNEIDDPIVFEAVANIGARPYGRFGTMRRKRTHVKLVAKEKEENK